MILRILLLCYVSKTALSFPTISNDIEVEPIKCFCSNGYCEEEVDICISTSGKCFSKVVPAKKGGKEVLEVIAKGCLGKDIEGDVICVTSSSSIRCCNEELCNGEPHLVPTLTPSGTAETFTTSIRRDNGPRDPPRQVDNGGLIEGLSNNITYPLYIVGVFVFLVATVLAGLLFAKFCRKEDLKTLPDSLGPLHHDYERAPIQDLTTSCSSGSGIPTMIQKTLIREITFLERIGKGRYGEVWRGRWRAGEEVAIKVFSNREEGSWWHEAEMYQNYWLRHENILSYIGADQKDCVAQMQYYLVLNFHARGSLYDFLQDAQLTVQENLKMVQSLASGLEYLHTDIKSSAAKPSIAHRDLKSKNILVKNNGTCCLADFGLSVRSDHFNNLDKKSFHFQVGTRRYMAPEILDSSINLSTFESFKKADMYTLGLVIWEMGQRVTPGQNNYEYPYQHDVTVDPSVEDMRNIVCIEGKRPVLAPSWNSGDHAMADLARIVQECWSTNPDSRLTCLRVKKDLVKLIDNLKKGRDSGCYYTDSSDQGFISWE